MKRGNSEARNADAAANLAANVSALRRQKRLSQQQLAELAGIPRSTITHMESGGGNPALSNLVRVARALGLGIEELLAPPRSDCELIPAERLPVREQGGVRVHGLLPENVKGLLIERMELAGGASMRGTPHVTGTKEYLHVIAGTVSVLVAGQVFAVDTGMVLAFPGDQAHSYVNRRRVAATAFSVVVPTPLMDG